VKVAGEGKSHRVDVTWCLREEPRHLAIRRRNVGANAEDSNARNSTVSHSCLNGTFYRSIASIDQCRLDSNF